MESRAIERLAESLKKGELPDAQAWDIAAATHLITDAVESPGALVVAQDIRNAGKVLNKHRHFAHTRMLCEAWRATRAFDPTIHKHHAQALIDLSALDAAEQLLREGLQHVKSAGKSALASTEEMEYQGLLGRVEKQRFVASGDLDALARATEQYYSQYAMPEKPYWHGINAVALRACEERKGVPHSGLPTSKDLATAIQKQVASLHSNDSSIPWLPATLSEASLALGKCNQAELWLYRFLHHRAVGPFALESYARQLREIWQGSVSGSNTCADRLATIIARHIARTQSQLAMSAADVLGLRRALERDPREFEKNFSGEGSFSLDTVKKMLAVCGSIGCVCNASGERLGTGFLVDGDVLKASLGPEPVFVTNAHVISETVPNAIRLKDVRVTFESEAAAAGGPVYYSAKELLFTSTPGDLGVRSGPRNDLDVTVIRLDKLPSHFAGLRTAAALPLIDSKAKVYVVGHPRGSGLQYSLHDSLLLDIDDDNRLVHYRTPTDPGSSGSPVFNALWEVVAIHHGGSWSTPRLHGSGTYQANEGVTVHAIQTALR